jgi:hypothetical protein
MLLALSFLAGSTLGALAMAVFSARAYDRGFHDGREIGERVAGLAIAKRAG